MKKQTLINFGRILRIISVFYLIGLIIFLLAEYPYFVTVHLIDNEPNSKISSFVLICIWGFLYYGGNKLLSIGTKKNKNEEESIAYRKIAIKRKIFINLIFVSLIMGTFIVRHSCQYSEIAPELTGMWEFDPNATIKFDKNSPKSDFLKNLYKKYPGIHYTTFKKDGEVIESHNPFRHPPYNYSYRYNVIERKGNLIRVDVNTYAPRIKRFVINYKVLKYGFEHQVIVINSNKIACKEENSNVWEVLNKVE